MIIKTYSELITIPSFEERFNYLKLRGKVGEDTFGFDRIFNQKFYNSQIWKSVRDEVIIRDNGCDLAVNDFPISGKIIIHHMNPITQKDIFDMTDYLMNHEYLICVSLQTHNAIHYSDDNQLPSVGPGQVLHDLVEANAFACVELKKIFRQAAQSPAHTSTGHGSRGGCFFLRPSEITHKHFRNLLLRKRRHADALAA